MDRDTTKRFAICFPSGRILFCTNDVQTAANRWAYGWTVRLNKQCGNSVMA